MSSLIDEGHKVYCRGCALYMSMRLGRRPLCLVETDSLTDRCHRRLCLGHVETTVDRGFFADTPMTTKGEVRCHMKGRSPGYLSSFLQRLQKIVSRSKKVICVDHPQIRYSVRSRSKEISVSPPRALSTSRRQLIGRSGRTEHANHPRILGPGLKV